MFRLALIFALLSTLLLSQTAHATLLSKQKGWVSISTKYDYKTMVERVLTAAKVHKIGVVTRASATVGAAKVLNKKIPGNMVIGLYHPRFAVPMLEASIAAGIEAPIRVYITENANGTTTFSYKTPSFVFAPYMEQGGKKLQKLANELDKLFASLALHATK